MSETVEQYKSKLLAFIAGKDPIKVMSETPRLLAEMIHAYDAESLRERPRPEKWSVGEILAHLSETELVSSWRYRQVLEHHRSAILPYDQNLWAEWGDYASCDPKESLEQFRLLRQRNLGLLARLTPEQWEMYGIHGERGNETVRLQAKMVAGHDLNHVEQARVILGA